MSNDFSLENTIRRGPVGRYKSSGQYAWRPGLDLTRKNGEIKRVIIPMSKEESLNEKHNG